jgi:hypothetical protein
MRFLKRTVPKLPCFHGIDSLKKGIKSDLNQLAQPNQ